MAADKYRVKQFDLAGLKGISERTVETHLGLYEGYVTNVNALNARIDELAAERKNAALDPAYHELKRRLGFEYGGMVLHELYFGALRGGGDGTPTRNFVNACEVAFGSYDAWRLDFTAVGSMRGIGWAVLFEDPATHNLSNHWIELHHDNVPASFKPVLVMDVWEHAYLLDYKPSERGKYIDAFFANVDWPAVERRLADGAALRPAA